MSTQRRIQNSDLRLVRPMRQTPLAHQAQSEILADEPSNPSARSEIDMMGAHNMTLAVRVQVGPQRPGTSSTASARHAEL